MISKHENNIFLEFLKEVKPLKKNNKIIKPLPKTTKPKNPKIPIKEIENNKICKKEKIVVSQQKVITQKNDINKKLKKNKIQINRKIDFHGCSLEKAKKIFINTINDCFLKNYRCILFVTGKGSIKKENNYHEETKLYYGKIRNNFISWTTQNSVQSKILNVQQANIKNGGDGAFFVYLRKNKN